MKEISIFGLRIQKEEVIQGVPTFQICSIIWFITLAMSAYIFTSKSLLSVASWTPSLTALLFYLDYGLKTCTPLLNRGFLTALRYLVV